MFETLKKSLWMINSLVVNTFRTHIRSKLSLVILLFAFALLSLMTALSAGSLSEESRLLKDIGLFLISTFSALSAVILSAQLIYRDIELKSIYSILSKPISRNQYIFGKYIGTALSLLVLQIIMAISLWICAWMVQVQFEMSMIQALLLVYLESLVVSAITLFFGSFSTGNLAGFLGFGLFVIGRLSAHVQSLLENPKELQDIPILIKNLLSMMLAIVPNFSQYNLTEAVVYDGAFPWSYLYHLSLSGFAYIGLCLIFAMMIFRKRDFV
jgi:ABC-type transport system involved in multi-copper enzyme maturation permease subunit